MLKTKRIYKKPEKSDGIRVLVDKLWPGGITKSDAKLDFWMKNIAPSGTLIKWYNHNPRRWRDFKVEYFKELKNKGKEVSKIAKLAKRKKVTLIYSAKEDRMNQAEAIRQYMEKIKIYA